MKSQFPSAISGLRGQGPNTLSKAHRPQAWMWAALATRGRRQRPPITPACDNTCTSDDKRFKNSIFI